MKVKALTEIYVGSFPIKEGDVIDVTQESGSFFYIYFCEHNQRTYFLHDSYFKPITDPIIPRCECGAKSIGYVNPGRQHSYWCPMFKE